MPNTSRSSIRLLGRFDVLEDRNLPTTWGLPWPDPGHLTLSFAPDGTETPAGPSTLAATMSSASGWNREMLRAFQSWAVHTNLDIGVVADGGQAIGTHGAVQGDQRFGDVRIAAGQVDAGNELAAVSPFNWSGTTHAGDILFDNADQFRTGNIPGTYDVFSVAAHEAGHVFGLDHSSSPGSVLNEAYSYHTGLSSGDIARIKAMYGQRVKDSFEGTTGNETTATASTMPSVALGKFLARGDLTTLADRDYYKFTTPLTLGSLVVRLKASGQSLLAPRVTVYNFLNQVVGSSSSNDPLSNDITLNISSVSLLSTYRIKVESATSDVFGVGGYQLAVDYLPLVGGLLTPLTTFVAGLVDGHTDDNLLSALGLLPQSSETDDQRFDFIYRGVIEDGTDVDTFKIRSPENPSLGPVNLNVLVWGRDAIPLDPRVRVYNTAGQPVAYQILANDAGVMSVQVLDAAPDQDYYVQVAARTAGQSGGYYFAADFHRNAPVVFEGQDRAVVGAGQVVMSSMTLTQSAVYEFALAVHAGDGGDSRVVMDILNEAGNSILSLSGAGGDLATTRVRYLREGTYTIRYTLTSSSGFGFEELTADLFLQRLTDPIGPKPSTVSIVSDSGDGTVSGSGSGQESGYTYAGGTTKPTTYAYYF